MDAAQHGDDAYPIGGLIEHRVGALRGSEGRRNAGEAQPATAQPQCLWCLGTFRKRTSGGTQQRFCRPAHRHAFGTAARRWAILAVERGLVTVETLKVAQTSARAVPGAPYWGGTGSGL
jgi:hypothetical protein